MILAGVQALEQLFWQTPFWHVPAAPLTVHATLLVLFVHEFGVATLQDWHAFCGLFAPLQYCMPLMVQVWQELVLAQALPLYA